MGNSYIPFLSRDFMTEITYDNIILTGILITGLFWVIRTISKDRKRKRDENPTKVQGIG
jgi:hypothetical protein